MGGLILFANDIIGGQGVYVARSMYESIEPRIYEDGAICAGMGSSDKTELPNTVNVIDFIITPNPANHTVSLAISGNNYSTPLTIVVYNALGQQVKTINLAANMSAVIADVSELNNGVYWCQIVTNMQTLATQKLVIVK